MARGQAKNRFTDISYFMHGCRNLFIWFCNFSPFQNAELWMHYFIWALFRLSYLHLAHPEEYVAEDSLLS